MSSYILLFTSEEGIKGAHIWTRDAAIARAEYLNSVYQPKLDGTQRTPIKGKWTVHEIGEAINA